ncbi:hypothetical protein C5E07_16530 [Pseudoclavibacter sp. RFBJ3]|uniref:DUF5134 domain-containing protein n=1 Tax=unclassified Pseudoclavibacter TaxID=2615177 RepID=UPI000CE782E8|nr:MULTISPECIES: DUF5134 domain-containing protein [unclassified Pseudoclavibacter]PPF87544.1 hypothetical protein C5C12_00340 [Pseudoclavibacter sp. RFBJ5]PPF90394.1 hypothetical protein C5E07_16530 [Pseudoclavibacter sp. RFBJ3]PPG01079.1 hypothetical protein C5C19_00340 [Pseudoclavibacter sp. RFBH5]PPG26182.1 hypothetical protein C5E13_00295 [Pseudoclavibacter sp. RFBI4]
MITAPFWQWGLSALFAATAVWAFAAALRNSSLVHRTSHVLHGVMSLGMVAMCWPWWTTLPAVPQLIFFSSAGAWFVALACEVVPSGGSARSKMRHDLEHAVMMFAMVWMIAAMESPGGAAQPGTHEHGHTMDGLPASVGVAVLVALAVQVVLGVVDLVEARPGSVGAPSNETTAGSQMNLVGSANLAMAAGMAIMCWVMVLG